MTLYHGSNVDVVAPDLLHSRPNVDFGKGFYTTPLYEQAVNWVRKFKTRGDKAIIAKYEFDEPANAVLKIMKFESYSEEWLDFILNCRAGKDSSDYDIVMGGVANDKVFNTVELYFNNLIDKMEALKRLKYEKPNWQVCFRTEKSLNYLRYIGSERL